MMCVYTSILCEPGEAGGTLRNQRSHVLPFTSSSICTIIFMLVGSNDENHDSFESELRVLLNKDNSRCVQVYILLCL